MLASRSFFALLVGAGAVLLTAGGCGGAAPADALAPAAERAAAWEAWRAGRDSLFRSPASPLLPDQRAGFDGLGYFPYDPALAFPVALEPVLAADTLRLTTTTGEVRGYLRLGHFTVPVGGAPRRLTVFLSVDPGERVLFIPFTDPTNGRATYGGGRYFEIPLSASSPDGAYVLDFNYAFSPYCAYDPRYSCPVPPPENRVPVPVRAGERHPPAGAAAD